MKTKRSGKGLLLKHQHDKFMERILENQEKEQRSLEHLEQLVDDLVWILSNHVDRIRDSM